MASQSAWTRLPAAAAVLVDMKADRCRADKAYAFDVRMLQQNFRLVPGAGHQIDDAGRQAGFLQQPQPGALLVIGVMLAALITMVLPVAMHMGIIQPIGIMPGKLKGTMQPNTPRGSR